MTTKLVHRPSTPPARRAFLFGSAALLVGCAHNAPWQPERGWTEVRSRHFRVYTTRPHQTTTTIEALEVAHGVLAALLIPSGERLPAALERLDVLLADSTSSPAFNDLFGWNRPGATLAQVPGASDIGAGGLMVLGTERGSVNHALSHLFIHVLAPDVPFWFHEGVAKLMGDAMVYERDRIYEYAAWTPVGGQPIVPVARLLASTARDFDEGAFPSHFSATAMMMVSYLLVGEGGRLRERFLPLVQRLGTGERFEVAFAALYPDVPVGQLDARLRREFEGRVRYPRMRLVQLPPIDRSVHRSAPAGEARMRTLIDALERLQPGGGWVDFFRDAGRPVSVALR